MADYKLGDCVKVKEGIQDPDFKLRIGGWQGRIMDIYDVDNDTWAVIEWDSLTLKSMPEDIITACLDEELAIHITTLSINDLEPASFRDKKQDVYNALQAIHAKHGYEYKTEIETLTEYMFGLNDLVDDEWDEEDEFPFFDLEQFFADLKIDNKKEQQLIEKCFGKGLETYYEHIYGYDKYGKNLTFLINERMGEPYIFGFGMVEVLRHKKIGDYTKAQIANYTLQIIDPEREYGVPHGLIVLLTHAAAVDGLPVDTFRGVMQLTQVDRFWADGWSAEEIITLSDWLITNKEILDEEKLWWFWYFSSTFSDKAHTGKKAVNHWLAHEDFAIELKRELCWTWLSRKQRAGTPPAVWRLAEAQYQGNSDAAAEAMRELGASEEEITNLLQELENFQQESPFLMLFAPASPMFIDPVMPLIHMPNWVKRLSVPILIRLGEDPSDICELLLDHDRDYGSEAVNQGVADAIREFQDRLTPNEIRALIEKGLQIPQTQTRKTFYMLSTEFYGKEYLLKTQNDNAASIRKWGVKQLQKYT